MHFQALTGNSARSWKLYVQSRTIASKLLALHATCVSIGCTSIIPCKLNAACEFHTSPHANLTQRTWCACKLACSRHPPENSVHDLERLLVGVYCVVVRFQSKYSVHNLVVFNAYLSLEQARNWSKLWNRHDCRKGARNIAPENNEDSLYATYTKGYSGCWRVAISTDSPDDSSILTWNSQLNTPTYLQTVIQRKRTLIVRNLRAYRSIRTFVHCAWVKTKKLMVRE